MSSEGSGVPQPVLPDGAEKVATPVPVIPPVEESPLDDGDKNDQPEELPQRTIPIKNSSGKKYVNFELIT